MEKTPKDFSYIKTIDEKFLLNNLFDKNFTVSNHNFIENLSFNLIDFLSYDLFAKTTQEPLIISGISDFAFLLTIFQSYPPVKKNDDFVDSKSLGKTFKHYDNLQSVSTKPNKNHLLENPFNYLSKFFSNDFDRKNILKPELNIPDIQHIKSFLLTISELTESEKGNSVESHSFLNKQDVAQLSLETTDSKSVETIAASSTFGKFTVNKDDDKIINSSTINPVTFPLPKPSVYPDTTNLQNLSNVPHKALAKNNKIQNINKKQNPTYADSQTTSTSQDLISTDSQTTSTSQDLISTDSQVISENFLTLNMLNPVSMLSLNYPTLADTKTTIPFTSTLSMPIRKNFSKNSINVHTGTLANTITTLFHADALTIGDEIFFHDGKFDLSSGSGRGLFVHELTHIAQQENISDDSTITKQQYYELENKALTNESLTLAEFYNNSNNVYSKNYTSFGNYHESKTQDLPQNTWNNFQDPDLPITEFVGHFVVPSRDEKNFHSGMPISQTVDRYNTVTSKVHPFTANENRDLPTVDNEQSLPQSAAVSFDIGDIADQVYEIIADKISRERERKGYR